MAGKLLLPGAVISAALVAVLVPFVKHSNTLLRFSHDFTVHEPKIASLQQTCVLQHPSQLVGCEDMHLVGNTIYTACLTDFKNRNKYWPQYSRAPRDYSGDKLFRWDLDTDSVVELQLQDFPGGEDAENRSFHGMDVNILPDGKVSIYIINHLRFASVIDKFIHDPKTAHATHVLRVPTTADGAAYHPNDIFAIPENDDDSAMYVTNDHYHAKGFPRKFEELSRRPWAWVSYYSKSTGWRKVLPGMIGSNGISGDKDPKGRKIYVSEITNGNIRVLEPLAGGDVKELQKIPIATLGDNLARSGDDLYIAGPARVLLMHGYMKDPATSKEGPGMVIKRLNTKQLGGFFGDGYTSDPIVEELIVDVGVLGNMSTTAFFRPYAAAVKEGHGEEETLEEKGKQKGDLFVTGLTFKGILKCSNFE